MLKWDTPKTCPLHRYEMTKKKKDPLYNGGLQQGQPLWKVLSALHRNDDLELVWEWFWLKSFLYRALVGGAFIRNTFKENCLVLGWCLDINNKKKKNVLIVFLVMFYTTKKWILEMSYIK